MKKYVMALDQGTTSSRAILFDKNQQIVAVSQQEYPQIFPQSGWVEHDPMDIFNSQNEVMLNVIHENNIDPAEIAAIGITNQRETTILWDKNTGEPVFNAIVWQCRRTSAIADKLRTPELEEYVRSNTGLTIDAYFSGTKIKWILDNVEGVRERAERGDILFGTVETWLIWKLTGGKVHVTDYSNASRTMIFNIRKGEWDPYLCEVLGIPMNILPKAVSNSEVYGYTTIDGVDIPISGAIGDQQAALFGQTCYEPGDAKITYGTGCFLLMNMGTEFHSSKNGLTTTVACRLNNETYYALEGSVYIGGAVIQWLRDGVKLIKSPKESNDRAVSIPDNDGVYLVPAFTGLGAPYWNQYARGCLIGITRGTTQEHIIRAAEESIAYQCTDIVQAMIKDTGEKLSEIQVDGGASRDNFLMQFQAGLLDVNIVRPTVIETTGLGAASMAGLAVGFWKDTDELKKLHEAARTFVPEMSEEEREKLLKGWHKAVSRSLDWEE